MLDAFLKDPVPPYAEAGYSIEERAWFLDEDGVIREIDHPLKMALLPLVEFHPALLAQRASEMLLRAAERNEPVEESQLQKWFDDHDIDLHSRWTYQGKLYARTDAEFLGIRPYRGKSCNLLLFNPNGVVQVKGPSHGTN